MLTASSVAAYLALIWAAVLVWLAIGAALRRYQLHARFRSRPRPSAAGRRVLIVRPCAGAEPGLRDNLLSITEARSTAELRLIMSVDSPDDGARPIAEEVAAHLRGLGFDARVEIHPPIGPNRKASMIAEILREHGRAHELVVNVDSNVDLANFELDALLAPVLGPDRVGVAWAPWVEHRGFAGVGPRASEAVLGGSLTAFPLLCGIHPNGLVGKIWAARLDALAAAGGFGELASYLGEDLAMADRLRAAGWTIAVVPVLGRVRGGQPSLAQVIERIGRWMLVVRGQQPRLLPTYPLFFFATPMVCALALLGAAGSPELAATALGLAVGARLLVTLAARYWSGRGVRALPTLVDAVLSDSVLMLAWLRAVSRREVEWRGHRLRVEPGGQLSSVE
ncbi:MAG: glycosyltransferase [Enhygromyxa sp.]